MGRLPLSSQGGTGCQGLCLSGRDCPGDGGADTRRVRGHLRRARGRRRRTAQVIVQAPPEIQARISQVLAERSPAANPNAKPEVATTGVAAPRRVVLRHLTAEQLEASLWGMLGNRLSAIAGAGAQARRYRLALAGNRAVDLTIHPAARQVEVDGPAAAAESCRGSSRCSTGPRMAAAGVRRSSRCK